MEEDYQTIYPPTTNTRSDYLTITVDGELIDINKLEMNEMNSTKSSTTSITLDFLWTPSAQQVRRLFD